MFEKCLSALCLDQQEHVANIFCPTSDVRPMSDEHYQLLVGKREDVCKFLDPLSGILDDGEIFSIGDRENVRSKVKTWTI